MSQSLPVTAAGQSAQTTRGLLFVGKWTGTYVLIAWLVGFLWFPTVTELELFNYGATFALTFGAVVGSATFFAILCGLYGESWITSFVAGSVVLAVAFVLVVASLKIVSSTAPEQIWSTAIASPGIALCMIAPLLFMKHFWGWRLVRETDEDAIIPSSIGSMFASIFVVAAVLIAVSAPKVSFGGSTLSYWFMCVLVGCWVLIPASVLTLPTARLVNIDSPPRLLTWLAVLTLVLLSVFVGGMFLFGLAFGQSLPGSFAVLATVGGISGMLTLYLGLRAIYHDGFRFRTKSMTDRPIATEAQLRRHRRGTVGQISLLLVLVLLLNVATARISAHQSAMLKMEREMTVIAGTGSTLFESSWASPNQHYLPGSTFYGIQAIDLSDSALIEIEKLLEEADQFENLRRLRLGGELTDQALSVIARAVNLEELNLSGTRIRGEDLSMLAGLPIHSLKLENLNLENADWSSLAKLQLANFSIRGSRVDNQKLAKFIRDTSLNGLDLAGVSIDDALLSQITNKAMGRLNSLALSPTDEQLKQLANGSISLFSLTLLGPGTTDASVDSILDLPFHRLELIDTAVTDAGAMRLGALMDRPGMSMISFSGTPITEAAFSGWKRIPQTLNLSRTNVGDSLQPLVAAVGPPPIGLYVLDLSDTKVTDKVLPVLGKLGPIQRLRITGTQLSVDELIGSKPVNLQILEIAAGEFSDNERERLRKAGYFLTDHKED